MSQENTDTPISVDMRRAAYAAPSAAIERQELEAARQQAEKERIANLGSSAEKVQELEAQLAKTIGDLTRARIEEIYAKKKLEQVFESVSAAVGRDVRPLGLVQLGMVLTCSKSKLVTLASYIERSLTLDDLVVLKRVASNLGVTKPTTMAEAAQLMGLSLRGAV